MGKKVWVPVVSGPLAPYAAGFESWLRSQACSPSTTAGRLCQFDQVSRTAVPGRAGGSGRAGPRAVVRGGRELVPGT